MSSLLEYPDGSTLEIPDEEEQPPFLSGLQTNLQDFIQSGALQNIIAPGRIAGDLAAGGVQSVAPLGQIPGLIQEQIGSEDPLFTRISEFSSDVGERMSAIGGEFTPENPTFVDEVIQGVGSTAPFMLLGFGTAGFLSKIYAGAPKIASMIGATSAAVVESAVESGSTFEDLQKRGVSPEEASREAGNLFQRNLLLNAVTNRLGPLSETGGVLKRAGVSALTEGIQEGSQELLQQQAAKATLGTGFDLGQAGRAGLIGSIVGGGTGGAIGLATGGQDLSQAVAPGIIPEGVESGFARTGREGVPQEPARAFTKITANPNMRVNPTNPILSTKELDGKPVEKISYFADTDELILALPGESHAEAIGNDPKRFDDPNHVRAIVFREGNDLVIGVRPYFIPEATEQQLSVNKAAIDVLLTKLKISNPNAIFVTGVTNAQLTNLEKKIDLRKVDDDQIFKVSSGRIEEEVSKIATERTLEKPEDKRGISITTKGFEPKAGYAVSAHKPLETKVESKNFKPQTVKNFLSKNKKLLSKPNSYIGIWFSNGVYFIDVSTTVTDINEAMSIARASGQEAIYDVAKGEEIPVNAKEDIVRPQEAEPRRDLQRGEEAGVRGEVRPRTKGDGKGITGKVKRTKESLQGLKKTEEQKLVERESGVTKPKEPVLVTDSLLALRQQLRLEQRVAQSASRAGKQEALAKANERIKDIREKIKVAEGKASVEKKQTKKKAQDRLLGERATAKFKEKQLKEEVKARPTAEKAFKAGIQVHRQGVQQGTREGKQIGRATERERAGKVKVKQSERAKITQKIKQLKKVDVKKLRPEFRGIVEELTFELTLTTPSKRTLSRVTAIKEQLLRDPENINLSSRSLKMLDKVSKTPIRKLSSEEIGAVHDAVMNLAKQSRTKNKLIRQGKLRDLKETVTTAISELVSGDPSATRSLQKGIKEKLRALGLRQEHADLIVETMVGGKKDGVTYDILVKEPVKGYRTALETRQELNEHFSEDLDAVTFKKRHGIESFDKWMEEDVKAGTVSMKRHQRIKFYQLMQNENGVRHITNEDGGITTDDPFTVRKISPEEATEMMKDVSEAEKELAEAMFNTTDEVADRLAPKYEENTGVKFPKENNYTKIVVVRGVTEQLEAEPSQNMGQIIAQKKSDAGRISLQKDFLEERVESNLPVHLGNAMHDFNSTIQLASDYIGMEQALTNAKKLLLNPQFSVEIQRRFGPAVFKELRQLYKDVASRDLYANYSPTSKAFLRMKNRAVTSILNLSPHIAAKQLISLSFYGIEVSPRFIMEVMGERVSQTKFNEMKERHRKFSPFFREREGKGFARDITDMINQLESKSLRMFNERPLRERLGFMIRAMDLEAVTLGMEATVREELAKLEESDLSVDEKMKIAYQRAEEITSQTQPEFHPIFRSGFSRGDFWENSLSAFGTTTNTMQNTMKRYWRDGLRTGNWDKFAKAMMFVVIINAGLIQFINGLRDWMFGRDIKVKKKLITAIPSQVASLFFVIRDAYSAIEYGTGLGENSIAFEGLDKSARATSALLKALSGSEKEREKFGSDLEYRKKWAGKFVDATADTALMFYGLPYYTPKQFAEAGLRGVGVLPKKFRSSRKIKDELKKVPTNSEKADRLREELREALRSERDKRVRKKRKGRERRRSVAPTKPTASPVGLLELPDGSKIEFP